MPSTTIEYEPVIGLEVHVQLSTRTKMFCGCRLEFGAPANSLTCPVCLGLPGALPVVNREAVAAGIKIGLALGCKIDRRIKFDRKNYFYPDLPKGYQITQYDMPLCYDGELRLPIHAEGGHGSPASGPRICRIERAHLEEDAGKSIHMENSTLVDLNRAGTPLVEIVGAPDLRSPEEAYVYLHTLKRNLSYLGVSDLSMEKGSLRCDANISIRPVGQKEFGVRSEVKNMNSFRAVRSALEHEIGRHREVLESGGKLTADTRLWDEEKLETRLMRSKEATNDYRFFPEPDLTQFEISRDWVEEIRATIPEMPEKRLLRFLDDLKLNRGDAEHLVGNILLADYYEAALKLRDEPAKLAAWITGELTRILNDRAIGIGDVKVTPAALVELIGLLDDGKLNNVTAKEVLREMAANGAGALETAKRLNRLIEQDRGEIDSAIAEVLVEFKEKAVADLIAGKKQALGFLVGQCMRKLKGKANPKELGPKIEKAVANL